MPMLRVHYEQLRQRGQQKDRGQPLPSCNRNDYHQDEDDDPGCPDRPEEPDAPSGMRRNLGRSRARAALQTKPVVELIQLIDQPHFIRYTPPSPSPLHGSAAWPNDPVPIVIVVGEVAKLTVGMRLATF